MSTKISEKKQSYKPKYQEKAKPLTKFNFVFDQEKITYKTEIPELPAKLRPKPNEQAHKKKVDEMRDKIENLKQKRKQKKQQYKKGSQNFDQDISKLKKNIDLGRKCIIVLNYDLQQIGKNLSDLNQKIQKKYKSIKNLQRGPRENKQQRKKYEQMTFEQIQVQQDRLSGRLSTATLSKSQQTQINAMLAKLARIKKNAPHGQKPKDNTQQIALAQQSVERLKNAKQNLQSQETQIRHKIQCIQQDIEQFNDQIQQIQQRRKNPETQALYQQSQQIKNEIYALRNQLNNFQKQFQTRKNEYQYEQAKIQWIKWATQIKKKIDQQWQAEKEQRRRQKLRQKNNKDKDADKKSQTGSVKNQDQKKPQRKIFNKHQKQIDTCTFLISYCQGLISKEEQKKQNNQQVEIKGNIEQVLKTGQWAKVKDAQIIKSKKSNAQQPQNDRIKKKKNQKVKQVEVVSEQKPSTFTHQFFTQNAFDLVKVIPPNKPEQVQQIIKQLNEKLVYFLEHPEGAPIKQKQRFQQRQQRGPKYGQKSKKTKAYESADFPSLF